MSLLLIAEIQGETAPPEFGGEFAAHIGRKRNPAVRRASLTAWNLLAEGLRRLECEAPARGGAPSGKDTLPAGRFGAHGKPEFVDCPLHFSLSHSGNLAAALISDVPCGVDVERVRPEVALRLRARCLSPEEQRRGLDFFECWTRKECIGKLNGAGMDGNPAKLDTLDARWAGRFLSETLTDSSGQSYALSALCKDAAALRAQRV